MVQRKLWTEFKTFVLKGNVVELAVAVVVGGAFNKVVKAFVDDLVMPALSPLMPAGDWRAWQATPLNLKIGDLIGSVLDFLIVSFVVSSCWSSW
jgi:large conductance mechanosensitive channel